MINNINNNSIREIKYYKGNKPFDLRIIFFFNDKSVLFFNSLGFYLILEKNLKYSFKKFIKLNFKSKSEIVSINNIYEIEGVANYIELSNNRIIHIYEEILNLDKLLFIINFDIVSKKTESIKYNNLLNEIYEDAEFTEILYELPVEW